MAGINGRPCEVCRDITRMQAATDMISAGKIDREIAEALGVGRMAIYRHRKNHLGRDPVAFHTPATKTAPVAKPRATPKPKPVKLAPPPARMLTTPEPIGADTVAHVEFAAAQLRSSRVGRKCSLCADPAKARLVAQLIAVNDREIAAQVGATRNSVGKHRREHVIAPAKRLIELASKGADEEVRRNEIMTATDASQLGPEHYLTLGTIVGDMKRTGDRLERVADLAEQSGQALAVSSLSSQQLRLHELRAKIGSVGSFAPKTNREEYGAPFVLTIQFGNGDETRIEAMPDAAPRPHTIDHVPLDHTTVVTPSAARVVEQRLPKLLPDGDEGDDEPSDESEVYQPFDYVKRD